MNKNIHSPHKLKQNAWKKYNVCRTHQNFQIYREGRNKLKQLYPEGKKEFKLKIIEEIKITSKNLWKYVAKKTKQTSKVCDLFRQNQL